MRRAGLTFLLTALLLPRGLGADPVRALVVEVLRLPAQGGPERAVELTLEEAAVVELPADSAYITGIEIELVLSNLLKKYFDSYALAVYADLRPTPDPAVRFYEGRRVLLQQVPFLNRVNVHLPVGEPPSREPLPVGAYRLETPLQPADFPILLTMLPLGKGVPEAVSNSKFYFSIRPVLRRQGLVEIRLRYPAGRESEQVFLYVDDRRLPALNGPLELDSGMHQLRVGSEAFREVNLSFAVESGKSTVVEVNLEEVLGQLSIDAPQGAEVYLDGEKLPGKTPLTLPVAEGAHLIRVKMADQSVSKKFVVQRGRHYHLSVVFDIIVVED